MAQPSEPRRSQSTTSLSRFYNGANGHGASGEDELSDPRMDFCNAFWGQGDKGYDVVMARLRGAARTVDELRAYWRERAAIEEDYAKRLSKLSKYTLGKDEIGDLAASLQNVAAETAAQASYHLSLSTEIKQNVEQPTAEFSTRLANLKKGLQASVEKSYRNKGLQEGHVAKAKERYEADCLKLNSYTANAALTQGKDLEKLHGKLDRVRQTIGGNEQDFRQFVKVLEGTTAKWENEWRGFCDHVQDLEEDRLSLMKDIIWAYANAISQVCVEDDGSCERVREKLEAFEPLNDMVTFVKGWGTGDQIADPPRFVNYSAGEYPQQPSSHTANFRRLSSKPPLSAAPHHAIGAESHIPEPQDQSTSSLNGASEKLNLKDDPVERSSTPQASAHAPKAPFGGVALPGMAATAAVAAASHSPVVAQEATRQPTPSDSLPKRNSSMGPPPVPPTMTIPEPRIPSRQGPPSPNVNDEDDPMARALADLRRDPPGPGSIRRNASHRRPESAAGSIRGNGYQHPQSPATAGGVAGAGSRMSYQAPPPSHMGHGGSRQSVDMTLSPPAPGHTAAQLARSMDDFNRAASRGPDQKRNSVNYSNYADDVVGAHPASRPTSPAPSNQGRAPSPAMMQPPTQPATHIADEVVSQYHQAFPGERRERNRSRAGSMISAHSRPGSAMGIAPPAQSQHQQPPVSPRAGFVGIGAGGGRSPSPQPGMHSPIPNSASASTSQPLHQGVLGPQNLGIALDKSGGVAHDSMAEAYRRQYQEQQQQQQQQQGQGLGQRPGSQYGQSPSQQFGGHDQRQPPQQQSQQQPQANTYGQPKSPSLASFGGGGNATQRPLSAFGGSQSMHGHGQNQGQGQYGGSPQLNNNNQHQQQPQQQQQPQSQQYPYQQNQAPPQPSYSTHPSYQQQQQPYSQQQQPQPMSPSQPGYQAQNGYSNFGQQPQSQSHVQPQAVGQQAFGRSPSPAPPVQQQYYNAPPPPPPPQQYRAPSPQPQPQQQYRAPSPQPQQQQQYRAPSPQPQQQRQYNASPQPGYQQQQQQYQQQPQQQQQHGGRSPSPQPNMPPANTAPTGQWSTTGLPVLFYVKALYDYAAQSTAEFDFQAGDIIAVTSTPEDGWWSGELLDEARRLPGRTDFPSNFVCLF